MGIWMTSSYLWIIIMLSIFESYLNLPLYVEHNYGHFMASGGRDLGMLIFSLNETTISNHGHGYDGYG